VAYREVLVTEVYEVLRASLGGCGKRPAAARGGVNVKTAARYYPGGAGGGSGPGRWRGAADRRADRPVV